MGGERAPDGTEQRMHPVCFQDRQGRVAVSADVIGDTPYRCAM
jgi:hypothetical protein